ncbi:hypothetical protein LH433_12395 [Laribacter hongkongensis]|uniref:hypothetical protein n=1 Tax=Laribacter hongkongensis TaxID=168471 RepID=UPI001EFC8364|nr:hypothetical protein [Laribacter hongkongensis]MCG9107519.1 hypothetical protein [Laribacter hongkongensis]
MSQWFSILSSVQLKKQQITRGNAMSASMISRIERLGIMTNLLPLEGTVPQRGMSLMELEKKMMVHPGLKVPHRRSLQRDLAELISDGIVGVFDETDAVPLYFRCQDTTVLDEATWLYRLQQLKHELKDVVSAAQLAKLFDRLKLPEAWEFDDTQLRILSDSLRLQATKLDHEVFGEVLRALKGTSRNLLPDEPTVGSASSLSKCSAIWRSDRL